MVPVALPLLSLVCVESIESREVGERGREASPGPG